MDVNELRDYYNFKNRMDGRPTFHMFGLDGNQDTKKTLMTPDQSSELAREYDMQKRFGQVNWDSTYNQTQQSPVKSNQNRMQQWAGGPVKQQNKLEKNYYMDSIGKMPRRQVTNMYDHGMGYDGPYNEIPTYEMYDPNARLNDGRFQNSMDQTNKNPNGYVGELYEGKKSPKWISQDSRGVLKRINRLAGPIGALPMVAPEAVGMIGAAQEAQQRGVNPMVNWLQRMTPVPVVAPTGNGGEVYNYQSGERYTPQY